MNRSMKHATSLAVAGCLALAAASGCEGPGAYEGENGDINFEHETGTAFSTPRLVLGGELVLDATDPDNDFGVSVVTATSTDPSVVEVLAIDDSHVTVRGTGVGQAELEVEAEDFGGAPIGDTLTIDVREPARHELSHECTSEPMAYYLPNRTYELPVKVFGPQDKRLAGERVTLVEAQGDAVEVDAERSTSRELVVRSKDAGATSTLRSTVNGSELTVGVRAMAQADGVTTGSLVLGTVEDDEPFRVGAVDGLGIHPTVEGTPICGYGVPMVIEPKTSEICTLGNEVGEEITERYESSTNIVLVVADEEGRCEFDVSLSDPHSETVLHKTIRIDIHPDDEQ